MQQKLLFMAMPKPEIVTGDLTKIVLFQSPAAACILPAEPYKVLMQHLFFSSIQPVKRSSGHIRRRYNL